MQDTRIYAIEEFMKTLKTDHKVEVMKDFLRFRKDDNYFKFDSDEEIERVKNTWAAYAFEILKNGLSDEYTIEDDAKILFLAEDFKEEYFDNYLLNNKNTEIEGLLKNAYLKYRLTKDYKKNDVLNQHGWAKHPEYENGVEEFLKTITSLINEVYDTNIEIRVDEHNMFRSPIKGNHKKNEVVISTHTLDSYYLDFLREGYNIDKVMNLLFEISKAIELSKLENIKRNEISEIAAIYTMEDYLESKSLKGTKLARAYSNLYHGIIANKLITINSSVEAKYQLLEIAYKLLSVENKNMNNQIALSYDNIDKNVSDMKHYYNDVNYVTGCDEDELEQEGLNKVYQLYVNGLKAMPKSHITKVTKYFAINGNALTYYDMYMNLKGIEFKILKEKDSLKKEALIKQKEELEEVINLVTQLGHTYKIEKDIYKLVNYKKDNISIELIMEVAEHPEDFKSCINRITTAYENLNQLASSGSPCKVKNILAKKAFLEKVMDKCEEIISEVNQGLDFDDEKSIYLKKVTNRAKLVALLQEITGQGILAIEKELDEALVNKTPILTNLNPGFKKFAIEAINCKGAKVL